MEMHEGLFDGRGAFDATKPIYIQLAEDIMARAVRGELSPGDKIPSARELAAQRMVNPNTVIRAYQELERDGFIVTRRGLGSFVSDDPARIRQACERLVASALDRALSELRELGLSDDRIAEAFAARLEAAEPGRGVRG
ncbi:DNA-binding transcriptional regulator YhcF (GntR family) [Deinobacterium chartae]|uniref:DNA-binding transcriptional regulator YhcF (GntR family) n=1 Tax=Deinobacterium chartae TaxID=521158 RepID=A0A841I393_9DEIO|nr:GntR family transcriptional regulator [Deinobacterium chartae]MBB6098819.1 DNA-binding transcriptional regulator YhcF (GntR family) [Deinobacterium chartae]